MSGITRRDLVKNAAILAAGAAVGTPASALARGGMSGGGMGGGGMGGGGMGITVIDPPVGAAFKSPQPAVDTSPDPRVVDVAIEAKIARLSVNGVRTNLWTYNGQHPGPTIRARSDQLLRVRMKNGLPNSSATNALGHRLYDTNLHTHGLHVTPGDNMNGTHGDNMMVKLLPGESTVYEYDLSKQRGGTLNFYHPHIHGCVADQMWGGMAGSLVIEDETDVLAAYPEKIMVLKDLNVANGAPEPHDSMMDYMHGLEGNTVMVNGAVNPLIEMAPGSVQRWRLVNACTARFFKLSLAGHQLSVVGTEGGWLDRPYAYGDLLLSPGERLDILVKASRTRGSYKFLSLPYSRMGMMGGQQVTLATVSVTGTADDQPMPTAVDPSATRVVMDVSRLKRVKIDLSMSQGRGYINGISYTSHEMGGRWSTMSDLGTWEVWEVTNSSGMDHPFHHHVNSAQVLSITGGDAKYSDLCVGTPAWKDVTIVPKMGKVELLMPVMDYAGMGMLHCHIIEHEDIGMMGVWHIGHGMDGM